MRKTLIVGRDLIPASTARALAKYQAWLTRNPTPDLIEIQEDPREALPFSLPLRPRSHPKYVLTRENREGAAFGKKPTSWKEWRNEQYWRLGR